MRIKCIDLNIWSGGKLLDNALVFLKKENADIITMQEVYSGIDPSLDKSRRTLSVVASELGLPYYAFAADARDTSRGLNVEWGNAIFSRFPLKTVKEYIIDGQYGDFEVETSDASVWEYLPRMYQEVEVSLGTNRGLSIHNIHGIWGTHGDDTERRLVMGKKIIEEIKGKRPLILTGDFNLSPNTTVVKNIEQYLTNVFKDKLTSSFNMRRKTDPGYATAVVDMMFLTPDIKIIDHYCPDVDISDHLPLVAHLSFTS